MKKIKLIAFLMILLISLCALFSCSPKDGEATDGSTEPSVSEDAASLPSFVIVRHIEVSKDMSAFCSSLKEYIESLGYEVAIETDGKVEITDDASKQYILLGDTTVELSQENKTRATGNTASYLREGNCVSVCAKSDKVLIMATEQMISSSLSDGKIEFGDGYNDAQKDYSSQLREGWNFTFPAYTAGEIDEKSYSCGYGLLQYGNASYMHVINNTSLEDFNAWKNNVKSNSYREVYTNTIEDNHYVCYESITGQLCYAYYLADLNKVRVVCDKESDAIDDFCYTIETDESPEFYMFYSTGTAEDLFLIHASDDTWIVIDGGLSGEDDAFGDDIFNFMKNHSENKDGKITISAWYVSHAHRDHFLGFHSMLKLHNKEIDLQRVILNIPDPELGTLTGREDRLANTSQHGQFKDLTGYINKLYPEVKVLKVHSGMEIQLADISFTVLYTQEDSLELWYSSEKLDYDYTNFNMTSIVSMIDIKGMRILELADNFRPDRTLKHYDLDTTLACDILKVGHHYIDTQADDFYKSLYDAKNMEYALVPNANFSKTGTYLQEKLGDNFVVVNLTTVYGFKFDGTKIVCTPYND